MEEKKMNLKIVGILVIVLGVWIGSCDKPTTPMYDEDNPDPNPTYPGLSVVLDSLVPEKGKPKRDTVYIYGKNFSPDSANNVVVFGEKIAEPLYSSENLIKVLPKGKRKDTVDVKVSVKGIMEWSNKLKYVFK
jgi:hypothetical protein